MCVGTTRFRRIIECKTGTGRGQEVVKTDSREVGRSIEEESQLSPSRGGINPGVEEWVTENGDYNFTL